MRAQQLPKVGMRNQLARVLLSLKKQACASPYLKYQTKTLLSLPFSGEWYVYWGGRTIRENYHAFARDQRFAYDFLILEDGFSYARDGEFNEDFFGFSQPILAPADGIVLTAVNDQPDREPGVMYKENPLGNHVILSHGNGEFSFLAHLKQGSTSVRQGDHVVLGQKIGECGNSGHSSEPHLHYHVQNTPIPFRGEGLPAQFVNYSADGKIIARGEPVAGQTVSNAS